MRDAEKTIGTMIDRQKVCFIGSVDTDGFPNVKAMLRPRKRNGITEIWFSTNTSSLKVQSFRNNPKACVYFCDRWFFRGAMLRGTVEVLEDAVSKELIWKTGDTMYYKKGVTGLLRPEIHRSFGTILQQLQIGRHCFFINTKWY